MTNYTFTLERLDKDRDTALRLGNLCFNEVDQTKGIMVANPDWDSYQELESSGMLRYYTVSHTEEGKVGFATFLITKSLHSKGDYLAMSDLMYILPEHRSVGKTLLNLIKEDMREQGVTWFSFNVKTWLDTGRLGKELGCVHYENVHQCSLK